MFTYHFDSGLLILTCQSKPAIKRNGEHKKLPNFQKMYTVIFINIPLNKRQVRNALGYDLNKNESLMSNSVFWQKAMYCADRTLKR